jgi:hypothetical protein
VIRSAAIALVVGLGLPGTVRAQMVSVDRGVRAEGLWCFPLATDDRQWVYLPAAARLASDSAGLPQFSFLRYTLETTPTDAGAATITKSAGGAVLHFLVLYETPPEAVAAAQRELRRTLGRDDVAVRGPIVFKSGRYALVSAILSTPERRLLASGSAPVFEGNRLALAFDLTPEQSSVLMQSFAMPMPDVSLVFDLAFDGLTDAYQAELTIDWAEVRKSAAFSAGGSIYFVGADVQYAIDELRRTHAITLRTEGGDAPSEALLAAVYDRLLKLLFDPVEPTRPSSDGRGGLPEALATLLDPQTGPFNARSTTGFGAYARFQLKELHSEGRSVLHFDHRAAVERHSLVTFNVGDLYRRFAKTHFKTVNAGDPAFRQREVHVGIDGGLLPDFDRYVNSVTLTLRKQHESGAQTVKELFIDRTAARTEASLKLVYGWNEDADPLRWLEYDYRTSWAFKGGGAYQSLWTSTAAPMVSLYTPYERRIVHVVGDGGALRAKGVRSVAVQIEYPFFGEKRRNQLVLRPGSEPLDEAAEITLPQGQYEYGFTITWSLPGNRRAVARGRDSSGYVFVDDVPAESAAVEPAPLPHG